MALLGVKNTKKARLKEAAAPIAEALEDCLQYVADVAEGADGLDWGGLTLSPSRQGDGVIAVLRVGVANVGDIPAEWGLSESGNYVVYGYGDTVPLALAALEAHLRSGEVELTWDKYANGQGNARKAPRKPRKTDSKGNPR